MAPHIVYPEPTCPHPGLRRADAGVRVPPGGSRTRRSPLASRSHAPALSAFSCISSELVRVCSTPPTAYIMLLGIVLRAGREAVMHRIRITALLHSGPSEEFHRLAILRRELYTHSPVEIDPDNPAHETRCDEQRRAILSSPQITSTMFVHRRLRPHKPCGHG